MSRKRAVTSGIACLSVLLGAAAARSQALLPTDAALRSGMDAIRAAVIDHHTLITHRRLPAAMARSFQGRVGQSISAIRDETRVPPEARATLDPLLVTIDAGSVAIGAGGDSIRQMDALFAITKALETYGRTFDHPGWKPVQER